MKDCGGHFLFVLLEDEDFQGGALWYPVHIHSHYRLTENGSQRLINLNGWSPVGGIVKE